MLDLDLKDFVVVGEKKTTMISAKHQHPINKSIEIHNIYPHRIHIESISGWWYTFPSEKYDFVSWDDEIPNLWKVIKIPWFQTTNQIYKSISPSGYLTVRHGKSPCY